jgi:hypothetical protein
MKIKKVYYIYVPCLNISFVAYNKNQLKKVTEKLQHENLKFFIKEKYQ